MGSISCQGAEDGMEYYTWRVAARAILCKFFGRSDFSRWADASKFPSDWDERSRLIAGMISAGSRVLDIGAGRQQLRGFLDPRSTYVGSDLVARDAEMLVIDLNARPLPRLRHFRFDVAVLAGVIEYVSQVDSLIDWLHENFPCCVVSYGSAKQLRGVNRLGQSWERASCGWVNSFTGEELVSRFISAGFRLQETGDWKTPEGDESILLFRRA